MILKGVYHQSCDTFAPSTSVNSTGKATQASAVASPTHLHCCSSVEVYHMKNKASLGPNNCPTPKQPKDECKTSKLAELGPFQASQFKHLNTSTLRDARFLSGRNRDKHFHHFSHVPTKHIYSLVSEQNCISLYPQEFRRGQNG